MVSVEGQRIRLRDFVATDLDGLRAIAEDDAIWTYAKFRLDPGDLTATLDYLVNEAREPDRRDFLLAVEVMPADLAGLCHVGELTPGGPVDLGWYLGSAYWGRGYASEATELLLRFAFDVLGVGEVTAMAHPDNVASIRVLEKSGMRQVGMIDEIETWQGPQSRVTFAASRDEFDGKQRSSQLR